MRGRDQGSRSGPRGAVETVARTRGRGVPDAEQVFPHAQLVAVVELRGADIPAIDLDALPSEQVDDPDPLRGVEQAAMKPRDAQIRDLNLTIRGSSHQGQHAVKPPGRTGPDIEEIQNGDDRQSGRSRQRRSQGVRWVRRIRRAAEERTAVLPEPDPVGSDLDRMRTVHPPRGPGPPGPADTGPAPQVGAEDPPREDLEVGMTLADLLVRQEDVRPCIAPDRANGRGRSWHPVPSPFPSTSRCSPSLTPHAVRNRLIDCLPIGCCFLYYINYLK